MSENHKNILILILVAIIGTLAGVLLSKNFSQSSSSAYQMPADDGKLAKAYKEENLVKTIRENAKNLQTCYLEHLAKNPKIKEGVMNLLVKVEENGKLSEVKITKDSFQEIIFEDCLIKKIQKFYLSPPPFGINRYLSYELGFKSEETAQREAKELTEKGRMPKVLPVK